MTMNLQTEGSVIAFGAFVHSRKCVKKIILLKGGESVYIETFGIFGLAKKHTLKLEQLNCTISRLASRGYIPLKRSDTGYFTDYLIDSTESGHFPDPFLFDLTAGLQRTLIKKEE